MAIGAKPCGRAAVGRAEDDQQEHERQHDLGDQAGDQRVAARRVLAVAVGGEAGGEVEAGLAAGDHVAARPRATIAAETCATMYGEQSFAGKRLPSHKPDATPPG